MAKRKVCGARHPMHSTQVRCGLDANHPGAEHFDSFYMRSWDDDDARDAKGTNAAGGTHGNPEAG